MPQFYVGQLVRLRGLADRSPLFVITERVDNRTYRAKNIAHGWEEILYNYEIEAQEQDDGE